MKDSEGFMAAIETTLALIGFSIVKGIFSSLFEDPAGQTTHTTITDLEQPTKYFILIGS